MKKLKNKMALLTTSALLLLIVSMEISCSSDDDDNSPYVCASCTDTPDALAINDVSARGIYKGIFIGSSGTLIIDIQNGSNTISATMVLDGVSIPLTSSVTFIDNEPYLAPFTGTYNGSPVSITFSVAANGQSPTVVTSDIPGHPNADFIVVKELSTSLIEAFEGTYSKPSESGTFNILLSRGSIDAWGGISRANQSTESEEASGTIENENQLYIDGVLVATISGDVLSGSFQDSDLETITVNGNRTL